MRAWTVRAGVLGEHDERALPNGVLGRALDGSPGMTRVTSREQFTAIGRLHPDAPQDQIAAARLSCGPRPAPRGLVAMSQPA